MHRRNRMKYLAYGSNLNLGQMAYRCPHAEPQYGMMLDDFTLAFKRVADIIPQKGSQVPVGIFDITEDCEAALDVYEGYPRMYTKMYLDLGGEQVMTYVMNATQISAPSKGYYDSIAEGYQDFGLDTSYLEAARKTAETESAYRQRHAVKPKVRTIPWNQSQGSFDYDDHTYGHPYADDFLLPSWDSLLKKWKRERIS